jgi:predicted regulator of Ras-like GTPase activity (Roadblock/LC7/MglB family)
VPDSPPPSSPDFLSLSYAAILRQTPKELHGKAGSDDSSGSYFQVSLQQIVDQLPHGAVRVQFGELRRSAPAGVFIKSSAHDGQLVDLPLSEIIPQLPVKAYQRPAAQKCLLPPDDVTDLFGPKGQCVGNPRILPKNEVTRSKVPPQPKPTPRTGPGFNTSTSFRSPATSRPAVVGPSAATPTTLPTESATSTSFKTSTFKTSTIRRSDTPPTARLSAPATGAISKPASGPAGSKAKALPKTTLRNAPATMQPGVDSTVTGIEFTKNATATTSEERRLGALPFLVDLADLAETWPDPIREEIAQLHLPHARVELPPATVCEGLKRGRVQFTWGQLRAWISSAPPPDAPSPHGQFTLDLPLNILTPQFLDYIRATPLNRKVASAEHITEFFRRAAETTAPAAAAPPAPSSPASVPGEKAAASSSATLSVSLTILNAGWPETILHEIQQHNLSDCRVELPTVETEAKLKTGKVDFLWKQVASWIPGCPNAVLESPHGGTVLNLPLSVLAPLFLTRRSGATQFARRPPSDLGIPDVFPSPGKPAGAPEAGAPRTTESTPEAKPAPEPRDPVAPAQAPPPSTKASPPAAPAPVPASAKKSPANLAELFGKAGKKSWTPKELVQATRQLPGVAGALIALHDGLLVAQSMPDNWKTDATAAFLPQIFGRINQCAKELNTGEVRAVGITTPTGTLQVYQAGIVYFAALSQTGTNLPLDDLQIVANELGRRTN